MLEAYRLAHAILAEDYVVDVFIEKKLVAAVLRSYLSACTAGETGQDDSVGLIARRSIHRLLALAAPEPVGEAWPSDV